MSHIGLIGDHNEAILAHHAIPLALRLAQPDVTITWLPTATITASTNLGHFDGFWCVPGSPYQSTEGALLAIRFAREKRVPFLGTCGGCQHALIEYARHVLGWADAEHTETAPGATRPVISLLACALVEATDTVRLLPGSRIAVAYGALEAVETYRCRYGPNKAFQQELFTGPLRISAEDAAGEVRAIELDNHPFFVGTLFQPERAALSGNLPPLVAAFLHAVQESAL